MVAHISQGPVAVAAEQQAAEGVSYRCQFGAVRWYRALVKPCSPGKPCIVLGSVVLLAVGLVSQNIIYLIYDVGCHLWKDLGVAKSHPLIKLPLKVFPNSNLDFIR